MVLNEVLTHSFEVEDKASCPCRGWCASCVMGSWRIAISSLKVFVSSYKLAALLTEWLELNSSVVGVKLLLSFGGEKTSVLTLVTGVTSEG